MGLVRDRTEPEFRPRPGRIDAPDPVERRRAVRDLPDTPEANAALAQRLEVEDDPGVRALIAATLAGRPHPEVVRALLPALASEEPWLRSAATEALAAMPDAVTPEIPGLLRSGDHDVRIMTVMLLGHLPHPAVSGWLADLAERDQHPNVVGCALSELVQLGPAPHAAVFRSAAARFPDDPFIAFLASGVLDEVER